jgi:hypothetical protein
MVKMFGDLFAGRGLAPLPTPQEFAAMRELRAKGLE